MFLNVSTYLENYYRLVYSRNITICETLKPKIHIIVPRFKELPAAFEVIL